MKIFKKTLALALSASLMLVGSLVINAADGASGAETYESISYSNNFDQKNTLNDLGDFNTYWAISGDGKSSLETLSSVEANYLTTEQGTMARKPYECSDWRADRDANKNLTLTTLMTQKYADLELNATMKTTDGGAGSMGFVIGQTKPGSLYYTTNAGTGTGYGIMFKRTGTGLELLIASEGKVLKSDGTWGTYDNINVFTRSDYDSNFAQFTGASSNADSMPIDFKIKMSGTILSVYIYNTSTEQWVQFGDSYTLPDYQLGYVSMVHSNAQTSANGVINNILDQYFDNLAISGKGVDILKETLNGSSAVSYENTFDNLTLSSLAKDFSLYYTVDCHNGDPKYYSQPNIKQIADHVSLSNGVLCLYKPSGLSEFFDPWYAPRMLVYKQSTFEDFEIELDYSKASFVLNWSMIQFGISAHNMSSWSAEGGYTFAFRNNKNIQLIHNGQVTEGYHTVDITSDYPTMKLAVKNKVLTVSIIDGDNPAVEIYTAQLGDDYKGGYVAFGGALDNNWFSRFSVKGNAKEPEVKYTATSVVVKPVNGYEYSIDGGKTFSTSNVFTGLEEGADYIVTQRTAQKNHLSASAASETVSVTICTDGEAYGDLDGNFTADAADLVILRKELFGISSAKNISAGDFNNNGELDIIDLVKLKKALG